MVIEAADMQIYEWSGMSESSKDVISPDELIVTFPANPGLHL